MSRSLSSVCFWLEEAGWERDVYVQAACPEGAWKQAPAGDLSMLLSHHVIRSASH